MARNERTPEQFEAIADELAEASNLVRQVAAAMRDHNMPTALVHVTLPEKTHIPAIVDWAGKLSVDVRSQLRSYVAGDTSKAELHRQKNLHQKRQAAKKTSKKKSG